MRRLTVTTVVFILLACEVFAGRWQCGREVARWGYGPARVVAVDGDTAVFNSGVVFMVADTSDPARPIVVGEMPLEDGLNDLALVGSTAVALPCGGGVLVIDLTDPTRPRPLGALAAGWVGEQVLISDGYAWIGAGSSGLRVIDLLDPGHPVEVGRLVSGLEGAREIAVVGGVAYVAAGHLSAVDVSDPAHPAIVDERDFLGLVVGVAAAGDRVYVASARYVGGWSWTAQATVVTVVDATDPQELEPMGELEVAGWSRAMAVSGQRVNLAEWRSEGTNYVRTYVINVSDPTAPQLLGASSASLSANDVVFDRDLAYVATEHSGLRVVDPSSPAGEDPVGVDLPGVTASVAPIGDDHAIAAEWVWGGTVIRALDLRAVGGVSEVASWTVPGSVVAISSQGERAFVLRGGYEPELRSYDLSEPAAPRELALLELGRGSARDLATAGHHAYFVVGGSSRSSLKVIDLSQPEQPREVALVELEYPVAVAVSDDLAAVIARTSPEGDGVVLVDVSDPEGPVAVGQLELAPNNSLEDVAFSGRYLVVGGLYGGGRGVLHVVDASDPANPAAVLAYWMPQTVDRLTIAGRVAFVKNAGSYSAGIRVLDLTNPLQPIQTGVLSHPAAAKFDMSSSTLAVHGTKLLSAQEWAGRTG